MAIIYRILQGGAQQDISQDGDVSKDTIQKITVKVMDVAKWDNADDYDDYEQSKESFKLGQYDETCVSKKKYGRGKNQEAMADDQCLRVSIKEENLKGQSEAEDSKGQLS